MSRARSLFLAACCGALALPAFAWADEPQQPAQQGASSDNAACDYERVCAERARAQAAARAQQRARRHRTAVRSARHAARPEPQPAAGAVMHVNTAISRPVADGCRYTAKAQGAYRSASLLADDRGGAIRDVDVVAGTTLMCGNQVVRHQMQHWVLPASTRGELVQAMRDRLALQVPGSQCTISSSYDFQGGNLLAEGVHSSCARPAEVAALRGYTPALEQRVPETSRGGGPALRVRTPSRGEPTSRDARYGTH